MISSEDFKVNIKQLNVLLAMNLEHWPRISSAIVSTIVLVRYWFLYAWRDDVGDDVYGELCWRQL